jgi:hypothetical protein
MQSGADRGLDVNAARDRNARNALVPPGARGYERLVAIGVAGFGIVRKFASDDLRSSLCSRAVRRNRLPGWAEEKCSAGGAGACVR